MTIALSLFVAAFFLWAFSVRSLFGLYRGQYKAHHSHVSLSNGAISIFAIVVSIASYLSAVSKDDVNLLNVFTFVFMFAVAVGCAITSAAVPFGPWLTRKFTASWVKALDFPYIGIAFAGLAIAAEVGAESKPNRGELWTRHPSFQGIN